MSLSLPNLPDSSHNQLTTPENGNSHFLGFHLEKAGVSSCQVIVVAADSISFLQKQLTLGRFWTPAWWHSWHKLLPVLSRSVVNPHPPTRLPQNVVGGWQGFQSPLYLTPPGQTALPKAAVGVSGLSAHVMWCVTGHQRISYVGLFPCKVYACPWKVYACPCLLCPGRFAASLDPLWSSCSWKTLSMSTCHTPIHMACCVSMPSHHFLACVGHFH